ncbi:hypothetical protein [Halanaerobium hydrogeniformans]|uniref:DUF4198 domain-containing protein n=1 Tax=Halanaerobium hydrogeniformans TaxID=656519 RepID=E4RMC3_HALHG|nr:hypothetical protein [Halanaerobium hydrogeniformans]ADQ14454.1 hypothetical protein Halsa_1011 [Halanaerobium hydrogeniformans]
MFKKKYLIIFAFTVLLVSLFSVSALAHCVWVELPAQTSLNEEFEVYAYYADPDDPMEERDQTELELYIIDYNGEKHDLDLSEQSTYYNAFAELSTAGEYNFILEREPNRYRLQQIRDFGKAVTLAGNSLNYSYEPAGIPLEVQLVESNTINEQEVEIVVEVLYEGEVITDSDIELFQSLEKGLITEAGMAYEEIADVEISEDGRTTFAINPEYNYVFETDYHVDADQVEDTGFFIREVRFRSTLFLPAAQ